ncbi:MAG: DUF2203 family protein [Fimbriimonadales bacterium]
MSSPGAKRNFSVEEANSLIPRIAPDMLEIQRHLRSVDEQRKRAAEAIRRATTNGHHADPDEEDALIAIKEITERIESLGCKISDHIQGVVEFPTESAAGSGVLIWRLGEHSVAETKPSDEA